MHILTLPDKFTLNPGQDVLPGEYLSENLLAAQLINLCGDGGMRPIPVHDLRPFDEGKDWNGKKILFMRAGGFGDLVELTPTLREIHIRWPKVQITVAAISDYADVLLHLPYVHKTMTYPVPLKVAEQYDAWVLLEKAVENNPLAKKLHMADLFAYITGLKDTPFTDWTEDKHPDYVVTEAEAAWAAVQYPRKPGLRRLCVQPAASGRCRVYDFAKFQEVLNIMKDKPEWEIFVLGKKGDINLPKDIPKVYDLANAGLTFRQSCAVLNASDVLIAPDSSLLHIAGAIGLPAVGLFGPFSWKLRSAYSPSVAAIQGTGRCAPCNYHENPGRLRRDPFPEKCPSRDKGFCEVLASITVKSIVAKTEKIARKLELKAVA